MAIIKSYSDLQQSKKLAEILPLESADMYWWSTSLRYYIESMDDGDFNEEEGHVRAWSLAALLGVLPILDNRSPVMPKTFDGKYRVVYHSTAYEKAILTSDYDNPVDACVAIIGKLHELKLL